MITKYEPNPPSPEEFQKILYLNRIRLESAYKSLRNFINFFRFIGIILGLVPFTCGFYNVMRPDRDTASMMINTAVIAIGILIMFLTNVVYEAVILLIDLTDSTIDHHIQNDAR